MNTTSSQSVAEGLEPCTIETAHCEDCGSTELTIGEHGPACEDCGGDITNRDDCDGGH